MGSVGEDHTTARGDRDQTTHQQRLTVHDAARRLGVSEDAVRMRIKRGTLSADKEGGRLYVLSDTEPTTDRTDELIEELRAHVGSLETQLEGEREANRENRRIIAALTSRIPAIEAPEARDSPETAEEEPERAEPRPSAGERSRRAYRSHRSGAGGTD
jgi:excisionase family DNA binding protein